MIIIIILILNLTLIIFIIIATIILIIADNYCVTLSALLPRLIIVIKEKNQNKGELIVGKNQSCYPESRGTKIHKT